jgi:hypothetical protein
LQLGADSQARLDAANAEKTRLMETHKGQLVQLGADSQTSLDAANDEKTRQIEAHQEQLALLRADNQTSLDFANAEKARLVETYEEQLLQLGAENTRLIEAHKVDLVQFGFEKARLVEAHHDEVRKLCFESDASLNAAHVEKELLHRSVSDAQKNTRAKLYVFIMTRTRLYFLRAAQGRLWSAWNRWAQVGFQLQLGDSISAWETERASLLASAAQHETEYQSLSDRYERLAHKLYSLAAQHQQLSTSHVLLTERIKRQE